MFPKVTPPMPKGNWKASLAFSPTSTTKLPQKELKPRGGTAKPQEKAIPNKPIAKISEKKKKRIKEQGSEIDLFRSIWNTRKHLCEICGAIIQEPKPESFAHRLGKGRYPEHRYNEKNVALVCSNGKCHRELDKKNKGNDFEILKKFV